MSTKQKTGDSLPTAEEFLKNALRSGLVSREDLEESCKALPREQREDAQVLADHLVRNGKLSRFQASKLLKGIHAGLIVGHFHVLTPLGRGGMGTVFLVRDSRTSLLAALKVLPPKLARTQERMVARFIREKDLSQKVAHPHIALTYEVGKERGLHYIAMEYIPGRTLSRMVHEDGRLPWRRMARLMAEVACGLEHAHAQGLIHRDLKPSNIIITPRDHAKVLDLGLAMMHGEKVEDIAVVGGEGYIVGSMDYIAPEQTYNAATVDRRCDLYSLGCTMYFALTGRPPFPGGNSRDKINRHRVAYADPIAELVPDLPPRLVTLIERLMRKSPDERYTSAAQVEQELRAWGKDEPVQPMDAPGAETFDELTLWREETDDVNLIALPEVERVQPMPRGWPPWLVLVLAFGAATLIMAAMVLGLALTTSR